MSRSDRKGGQSSETKMRVILLALGSLLLAILLFWVSNREDWYAENSAWQSTWNQIAGLVVATGLISIGWEPLGKRRFAAEVLAKARLSSEVVDAGLIRVTDQYLDDVEWAELFQGVTRVDIVVAYARTWRHTHQQRLRAVAGRKGTRLRVFLPDPKDERTMAVLADRFNTDAASLRRTVEEAIAEFSELATPGGGVVEVYVRPGDAVFSCYRFDTRAILTLYSHARDRRTSVPTLGVTSGKLFSFVYDEIGAIKGQSRKVYPAESIGGSSD